MWFELKTRRLGKSGVFILLKACPTGFFHGKMASPKFQFSSPGRRTWGIFNPCSRGYNISVTLSNICYLFYYIECSYLSCCLQIICYPSDFFFIIFWFCKLLGVIIKKKLIVKTPRLTRGRQTSKLSPVHEGDRLKCHLVNQWKCRISMQIYIEFHIQWFADSIFSRFQGINIIPRFIMIKYVYEKIDNWHIFQNIQYIKFKITAS
jgi:hypothetical protein